MPACGAVRALLRVVEVATLPVAVVGMILYLAYDPYLQSENRLARSIGEALLVRRDLE